jgi:EmrB/QacA subfamily drug resistance transporter
VAEQTVDYRIDHQAQPRHALVRRHPGIALAVIVTCQMMLILDVTVMNVALPAIRADLHFSATGLSWVLNAYALSFGGLLLLGGRAGDLLGRRRLFVVGVALFTLASLLGGFAASAAWLLAARVLQGVGAAIAGPNALALLTTTFTGASERIRALSIFSAVASGGFAIGLIVGGALTEWGSWRWVLFINVPFGLAVALLAPRVLKADQPGDGFKPGTGHLDLPGAVTATAGTTALVYGFIRAAGGGWSDPLTIGTVVAAVVLLGGFGWIETRAGRPLMPLRLFAERNRAIGYLSMLVLPAGMLAVFFFLTQFLQEVLRLSPMRTGFAFLPMAVVMLAVVRTLPRLIPRFGPKPIIVVGAVLLLTAFGWLTQISAGSTYAGSLLGPMLLLGFAAALAGSPLNVVIMSGVRPGDSGAASGILQTMQQVGGSLGLAIIVNVFGTAIRHGGHQSPPQVLAHGIAVAFTAAAVFATAGFVGALSLRR